ncbi:MAG: Lrp/AsnC family transcriptional regulator [Candidatus Methanomethyliaceae archaeon]|nr:Lrp/AsnC family transcriptional regulator [Candidatus Methanomethyliaceae archaeon]MDW7971095.1 Lrp/AsnC family transcriptional regulator [Nitrososphaerota archaeon]
MELLDNIDINILRELQSNCRASYRDIANKLGLSIGTVHNRIKRMKEIGIIKGFSVIVDAEKIGYELTAVILMQVDGGHIIEVEKIIASTKPVIAVYDITGDFDIIVIAKFRNREELNTFIKDVLKIPHVRRTVTSIALNIVKERIIVNV